MSDRVLGDRITLDFSTNDPDTGDVADADFLPTCEVFANQTDVPLMTPLVVKRVGQTGIYRVTFVATVANGFQAGSSYNVDADATVAGVEQKNRIGSFRLNAIAPYPVNFVI